MKKAFFIAFRFILDFCADLCSVNERSRIINESKRVGIIRKKKNIYSVITNRRELFNELSMKFAAKKTRRWLIFQIMKYFASRRSEFDALFFW